MFGLLSVRRWSGKKLDGATQLTTAKCATKRRVHVCTHRLEHVLHRVTCQGRVGKVHSSSIEVTFDEFVVEWK